MNTFILDNGGYSIKCGYLNTDAPRVCPNAVFKAKNEKRKPFVGNQISDCRDTSGLYFMLPYQKGYLVNIDTQKTVWDYLFGPGELDTTFEDVNMLITEPYFNFDSIQDALAEVFFEDYDCVAYCKVNTGDLSVSNYHATINPGSDHCLLVDSGYSFTHIVPYFCHQAMTDLIKRIDVGGKLLSNHLKEIISYRQLNVMEESYLINQVKEQTCFVSLDFHNDLNVCHLSHPKNTITRDYVLPDYSSITQGYVKSKEKSTGVPGPNEQIIKMNHERFTVPELLFHPSDIGISQMGIAEGIHYVIEQCPDFMRPFYYENILLTGGNCKLPNFKERLYSDLRAMVSNDIDIKIHLPENCDTFAWYGGKVFCASEDFQDCLITRKAYEEYGINVCNERTIKSQSSDEVESAISASDLSD